MKLPSTKTYWIGWLITVVGLFFAKLGAESFGFMALKNWAALGYLALIWVPIMFLNYFEQQPLLARIATLRPLDARHPFAINLTAVRVIFTSETLGDVEIARLRKRYHDFMKFALFATVAFPLTAMVLSS